MTLPRLLTPSLALNLVLLLAVGLSLRPKARTLGPRLGSTSGSEGAPSTESTSSPAPASTRKGAIPRDLNAWSWAQLDTSHWPAYRDGLRAIGCPERSVHEILEPLVYRRFAAQCRREIRPFCLGFWEMMAGSGPLTREGFKGATTRLVAEAQSAMDGLFFGTSVPAEEATQESTDPVRFLPEGKRAAVLAAQRVHQEKLAAFYASPEGQGPKRTQGERALQAELDQELTELLTPEDRTELHNRGSRFESLRELEGIDLTEKEISDIIHVRETTGDRNPDASKALKELLGEDRAAALERAQDTSFQQLNELSRRVEAAPESAVELWNAQRQFESMAKELASRPDFSLNERTALLGTLRESIEAKASGLLGARGFAAWKEWRSDWLKGVFQVPPEDPLAGLPAVP